ncbi:MAG: hypothetical protein ACLFPE_06015 [Bacteroidales bacterium]
MGFVEVLLTILGAVFIGLIFAFALNVRGPWGSFWTFLLVLVLAGLVAELWIPPVGPEYYGFGWFTTLFFILLFAIILAAATPPRRRTPPTETEPGAEAPAVALTVFFWIMLIFLFIAILYALFI